MDGCPESSGHLRSSPVERLGVAGMVFREVSVIEVREVLRGWLAGKSERAVAAQAGVDRKTS